MEKTYIKVCQLSELKENNAVPFDVNGKSVLLARMEDKVFAVENNCTHMDEPIGEGKVTNGEIQCPRHGAKFDFRTGRAVQLPAVIDLKTYEVKIENNQVMVAI
jgi:3-phenylpropionate/trans-cinnamate dioxygenase ferredoxin subunit